MDQRLKDSSVPVKESGSFQIRLVNDSRFFWLLILHYDASLSEWHELNEEDARALSVLAGRLSATLKTSEAADKINIGALGNIVSQFHLHIIARHSTDDAWPGPVWGAGHAIPCSDEELARRKDVVLSSLSILT